MDEISSSVKAGVKTQKLLFPALSPAGRVSGPGPGAAGNDYLCPIVSIISLRVKWLVTRQMFSRFRRMNGEDCSTGCLK